MTPKKDREDGPWTLTDALAEAFLLGFETATDDVHKDGEDALEDDKVADRLTRIHEKFAEEFSTVVEGMLDVEVPDEEEEEEEEAEKK